MCPVFFSSLLKKENGFFFKTFFSLSLSLSLSLSPIFNLISSFSITFLCFNHRVVAVPHFLQVSHEYLLCARFLQFCFTGLKERERGGEGEKKKRGGGGREREGEKKKKWDCVVAFNITLTSASVAKIKKKKKKNKREKERKLVINRPVHSSSSNSS